MCYDAGAGHGGRREREPRHRALRAFAERVRLGRRDAPGDFAVGIAVKRRAHRGVERGDLTAGAAATQEAREDQRSCANVDRACRRLVWNDGRAACVIPRAAGAGSRSSSRPSRAARSRWRGAAARRRVLRGGGARSRPRSTAARARGPSWRPARTALAAQGDCLVMAETPCA